VYFFMSLGGGTNCNFGIIFKELLFAYATRQHINVVLYMCLTLKVICVQCALFSVLVALCSFKMPFLSLGFSVTWRKLKCFLVSIAPLFTILF
jgi:hypothetical protein